VSTIDITLSKEELQDAIAQAAYRKAEIPPGVTIRFRIHGAFVCMSGEPGVKVTLEILENVELLHPERR